MPLPAAEDYYRLLAAGLNLVDSIANPFRGNILG
jgi:hypothetical protein